MFVKVFNAHLLLLVLMQGQTQPPARQNAGRARTSAASQGVPSSRKCLLGLPIPETRTAARLPEIDYEFFALNLCLAPQDVNKLADPRYVQSKLGEFMRMVLRVEQEERRLGLLGRAVNIDVPAEMASELPANRAAAEVSQRANARLTSGLGTAPGVMDKEFIGQENAVNSNTDPASADGRLDWRLGSYQLSEWKQSTKSAAWAAVSAAGGLGPRVRAFVDYQVKVAASHGVSLEDSTDSGRPLK